MMQELSERGMGYFASALYGAVKRAQKRRDTYISILPMYKEMDKLLPWTENLAVWCNNKYGTDIHADLKNPDDLISRVDYLFALSEQIFNTVQNDNIGIQSFSEDKQFSFSSRWLDELQLFPSESAEAKAFNNYWMHGIVAAETAATKIRCWNWVDKIYDDIRENHIVDNVIKSLPVPQSEETDSLSSMQNSAFELFQDAQPLTRERYERFLAGALSEAMGVNIVPRVYWDKSFDELYVFIDNARRTYRKLNEKMLLDSLNVNQQVSPISAEDAGKMINQILNVSTEENETMPSSSPKSKDDFYAGYEKNNGLPVWKEFHNEMQGAVSEWLKIQHDTLWAAQDQIAELLNTAEEYEEKTGVNGIVVDGDDAGVIIHYARQAVLLGKASEKYMNIVLNDTGISDESLSVLAEKKVWKQEDLQFLDDFFRTFDDTLEEKGFLFADNDVDYAMLLGQLNEMPHCQNKYDAAKILAAVIADKADYLSDEIASKQYDIVGHFIEQTPDLGDEIEEFLKIGAEIHSDVTEDDLDEIHREMTAGVVNTVLIPKLYHVIQSEQELPLSHFSIDKMSELSDDSNAWIASLMQYYAKRMCALYDGETPQAVFTPELKEQVEDYLHKGSVRDYYEDLVEESQGLLDAEDNLQQKYSNYRREQENSRRLSPYMRNLQILRGFNDR